jgi:hypothetical protein
MAYVKTANIVLIILIGILLILIVIFAAMLHHNDLIPTPKKVTTGWVRIVNSDEIHQAMGETPGRSMDVVDIYSNQAYVLYLCYPVPKLENGTIIQVIYGEDPEPSGCHIVSSITLKP